MRVALYVRVSTKDRGQDSENQLAQLRKFAEAQCWKVTREYVDRATGKNSDREEYKSLLKAASQRNFEVVLLWSFDRSSRKGVLETLRHLEQLARYGVGYRSYSCGIFKDAALAILAVVAEQERVRLSERTVAGLEKACRVGRIGGHPRATVDRTKVQQPNNEGHSMRAITARLGISAATFPRVIRSQAQA